MMRQTGHLGVFQGIAVPVEGHGHPSRFPHQTKGLHIGDAVADVYHVCHVVPGPFTTVRNRLRLSLTPDGFNLFE